MNLLLLQYTSGILQSLVLLFFEYWYCFNLQILQGTYFNLMEAQDYVLLNVWLLFFISCQQSTREHDAHNEVH